MLGHLVHELKRPFDTAVHVAQKLLDRVIFIAFCEDRGLIRAESLNITNTPGYGGPDTSFSSTRFGMLPNNQQNWPRLVQLAAKFFF